MSPATRVGSAYKPAVVQRTNPLLVSRTDPLVVTRVASSRFLTQSKALIGEL